MLTPPHDGFWIVPGRVLGGPYPGDRSDAVARAKVKDFAAAGVTVFVDLTEEGELEPYAHLLDGTAARHVRHPIRDIDIPTTAEMRETLATIGDATAAGDVVYVHCWGGVGRTGTVAGCLLIERGIEPGAVLDEIRRLRAGTERRHRRSPETHAQEQFVLRWRSADPA